MRRFFVDRIDGGYTCHRCGAGDVYLVDVTTGKVFTAGEALNAGLADADVKALAASVIGDYLSGR